VPIHSVFYIKTLILLLSPVAWKTNCHLTFSTSVLITASVLSKLRLITLSILNALLTLTICVSDALVVAKLMSLVYPVLSLFHYIYFPSITTICYIVKLFRIVNRIIYRNYKALVHHKNIDVDLNIANLHNIKNLQGFL
jgi:hypothetical protein